jgi:hypothetical protein
MPSILDVTWPATSHFRPVLKRPVRRPTRPIGLSAAFSVDRAEIASP